jgi:hypothetical protein
MSDEGLILTSLTDKAFGMVIGPYGATAALPMIIEFRMKCSFAPKGFIGMQYASKPNYWNPSWRPGEIYDGGNPASVVKVNTEDWQTYRIVAKSADDVKFFVVGREAEAIALKAFKDNNWGFKLMLYEKGTQAVMTNTMVSGDVQ